MSSCTSDPNLNREAQPAPIRHTRSSVKRKREASEEEEEQEEEGFESPTTTPATHEGETEASFSSSAAEKKAGHNVCEKRYRAKLNIQIATLCEHIPSIRTSGRKKTAMADGSANSFKPGQNIRSRWGKGAVLTKATEYISDLEERNQRLVREDTALRTRVCALEKMVASSAAGYVTGGGITPNKRKQADFCCVHGIDPSL